MRVALRVFSAVLTLLILSDVVPAQSRKPAGKTASTPTTDEPPAEIPAVPYLTLALIRDPSVQAELELRAKQVEAVQAAIAEIDEPMWRLRDVPIKQAASSLDEMLDKLRSNLKRELSPDQLERFDQIVLQARSWKAIVSPELAEKLKLSTDQISKLKTTLASAIKERETSEKQLAGQSVSKRQQSRAELRKTETRRFTEILTSKQQTEFSNLLGKPFDLSRVIQVGCVAPELRDVTDWINSKPVTLKQLRGNVVIVHFWAFGCINCVHNLPHYQSWQDKYAKDGVTIIGIHTPETDSERSLSNLQRNVIERKIEYPVVMDGASENWKAWANNMWPSVYLIDKQGRVRNWWYGELNWDGAKGEEFLRKRIEELLAEK